MGRMYATDLNKRHPDCAALWQRPKDVYDDENEVWFEKKPLGVNIFGEMMSKISKAADLSKTYTNHSIRAICITVLNDSGFKGRHIVTISGHRSEESIKKYCSDTSDKQKRDMSKSISEYTTIHDNANVLTSVAGIDDQFDDTISENELVLSASQTEELMNDILQGNVHLQPLNNISNMPNNVISRTKLAPVQSGIETSILNDNNSMANLAPGQSGTAKNPEPCSLMFHNCSVTINMAQE